VSEPNQVAPIYPGSIDLFYEESKGARAVMDALLIRYRTNTTTILGLATGAATFFGFSSSPKGIFFVLALAAYGVATLVSIAIYWPTAWRVNVAHDVAAGLLATTLTPAKLKWDLALGHQKAIAQSVALVQGWRGQASKFRVLLFATSLVVIFAGVNVYVESQHTATNTTHTTRGQEIP
jgi:hypothetical protein